MLVRTAPTAPPAYPLGPWSMFSGLGQGPGDWFQGETVLAGFAVPNMALAAAAAVGAFMLFGGKRRR